MQSEQEWPAENVAVLAALRRRLEAALGADPWALGHRAAALAMADELLSGPGDREPQRAGALREALDVLAQYRQDRAKTPGLRLD